MSCGTTAPGAPGGAGRELPGARKELPATSAFAGDDGSADPVLAGVLARHADGEADLADVVAALAGTRVLVPVLAHEVASEHTAEGLRVDREATAGVVALQVPDGRTALPVFTGVAALAAWRADARPVPAEAARAAASALAEGWQLLVVDPGGPVTVVVSRPAVQALAAGLEWIPVVRHGVVRADVGEAVARALRGVEHLAAVGVEPGRRSELAVVLHLRAGLGRAALAAVVDVVNARLAAEPVVAQADSIELRPVTAT